jgi:uncharacterized integral membrane protein (TIGR00698 family)
MAKFNRLDLCYIHDQLPAVKALQSLRALAPGLTLSIAVAGASVFAERIETHWMGKAWLEALVIAILLGAIVRTLWTPPKQFDRGIRCAAKTMLELAIVLMGATVSFGAIFAAGMPLMVSIVLTVIGAIAVSFALGRSLGLNRKMALLVACGNAICGNSAIAAVAAVIDADSDDIATSIAFTAVLGIGVVVALPFLAAALHLSPAAGGILAGLTVYAVPQVLAAAGPMGSVAIQVGTLVKLVRVLMLGPIVTGLSLLMARRRAVPAAPKPNRRVPAGLVPAFILAFLGLATVHSLGLLPDLVVRPAHVASGLLTVLAMAGLGLGVDLRSVSAAGPRVVIVVTASLLLLGTTAYAVLRMTGLA